MEQAVIALGMVAAVVLIAAAIHAIRVLSHLGSVAERVAESIDSRLGTAADHAGRALDEVGQTAREVRSRSEQMGRVLREFEAIGAALGVLVGAREIVGPSVSSVVSAALKRVSNWLTHKKPPGGESDDRA
ncbi:hypothetical protein AMK68_04130 [candidate division KD3-62 bacterium DG_56]|uniref:DUF948 domain-containing protein n=1 Tax=candidate division KD3-62 bacterium DG_56 TaxID=1704032 RepID=A0A0S7XL18_9BACT|nr:MAG: hypothetical protein AMK68_04130 [candidate division KD3-62 bacterium DG_56]